MTGEALCPHCSIPKSRHPASGSCEISRRTVYGHENPIVQWLSSHAPTEAKARPKTAIDFWETKDEPTGYWNDEIWEDDFDEDTPPEGA